MTASGRQDPAQEFHFNPKKPRGYKNRQRIVISTYERFSIASNSFINAYMLKITALCHKGNSNYSERTLLPVISRLSIDKYYIYIYILYICIYDIYIECYSVLIRLQEFHFNPMKPSRQEDSKETLQDTSFILITR